MAAEPPAGAYNAAIHPPTDPGHRNDMTVRTRIAPSPTGDPHVGTAYIALFNLCFARQHGGQFILRIEDTDQSRSTAASEQMIIDSLQWLGLQWDEGPGVGGPFGPYRQSERGDIYSRYAEELIEKGHAFRCYRSAEELDALREDLKARGLQRALKPVDLELPADEVKRRQDAGMTSVVRMRVPEEGRCEVADMLRGNLELDWAQVDAQILLKSDGMPTYHLANVVDDHLMEITHVIRGEEWINSAPKHKLLYEYFGWQMPVLCHMPLLRNQDKSKLSKRKNPTSINFYRRMGYLPTALTNYLGRMGWSMPDESEKFSLEQMIANFDINRVSLGGPVFDVEKLSWLNGLWLRDLSDEEFLSTLMDWAFNREYVMQLLPHLRSRVETRSEEHTSELQSRPHLVCRLLLEKKKNKNISTMKITIKNKMKEHVHISVCSHTQSSCTTLITLRYVLVETRTNIHRSAESESCIS